MRRVAIGLAVSLAVLPLASARAETIVSGPEFQAQLGGQLIYSWRGDPALGCGAAGVCDVSGSLTYSAPDASMDVMVRHGRLVPGPLVLESFADPAIVRVRRGLEATEPSACVDTANPDFLQFTPTPVSRGVFAYDVETAFQVGGFSSGRCAGPVQHDLAGVMPTGRLTLGRHSMSLDMAGQRSFQAGPFSGEMVSTLRGTLRRSGIDFTSESFKVEPVGRGQHRKLVTILQLGLDYRLAGVDGELVTSFAGLAPPLCDLLDACGTIGTLRYAPLSSRGTLDVVARRILRGERLPSQAQAIRELHAGRLRLGVTDAFLGDSALARVSELAGRSGEQPCSDTQEVKGAPLDASGATRALSIRLGPADFEQPDAFRTRCGGPTQQDVLGRHSLAAGTVAARAVGGRKLDVVLSATGAFSTEGYSGTRSGRVRLHFVLRATRLTKLHVPVDP